MSLFALHNIFIISKLVFNQLRVRVKLSSIENLHKNLNNRTLKYIFELLSPTVLKKSSSSLSLLRSSPCLPKILMTFLLASFKRFLCLWNSDIPSFKLLTFFTSSFRFAFSFSDASNSFLIISFVFFLFVFLTLSPNYK